MSPKKTQASNLSPMEQFSSPKSSQGEQGKPPSRNKSAFIIFSSEMRKKLKAEATTELNSNEMMIKLATIWKNLDPKEKGVYEAEAEADKERYQRELKVYETMLGCKLVKNKTKNNHVKKPCSSYGIFLRDNKDAVKQKNPEMKMADVLKVIATEWKKIDKQTKKKYEELAQQEKIRIKAVMEGQAPLQVEKAKRKRSNKSETSLKVRHRKSTNDCSESEECSTEQNTEDSVRKNLKMENESAFDFMESHVLTTSNSTITTINSPMARMQTSANLLESVDFSSFIQYDSSDVHLALQKIEDMHDYSNAAQKFMFGGENQHQSGVSRRPTEGIVDFVGFENDHEENSKEKGLENPLFSLDSLDFFQNMTDGQSHDWNGFKHISFDMPTINKSVRDLIQNYDSLAAEAQNYCYNWN